MSNVTWQVGITLDEMEEKVIRAALKFFDGNQTHTANALGIAVKTLYNKLKAYELRDEKRAAGIKEDEEETEKLRASLAGDVESQPATIDLDEENDAGTIGADADPVVAAVAQAGGKTNQKGRGDD